MKSSKKAALSIAGALIGMMFSACSASTQSLTYDLTENQCDTGSHNFSSQADMCAGLEDYKLNNGCAYDLRAGKFQSDGCPGTFTETNTN